jgi:radical S-adenosyl methionine domain-containing protein 2
MSIKTINFHLWEACNMRCKFCFATFNDIKEHTSSKANLSKAQHLGIIKQIADYKVEKINFVGGEPTLCKWLPDLVANAKSQGLKTSIVSNGWNLRTKEQLSKYEGTLDWLGISIDSFNETTLKRIGRGHLGKIPISLSEYSQIFDNCRKMGIKTKVNSVILSDNHQELVAEGINLLLPLRWKALQIMEVLGQNDQNYNEIKITRMQYNDFIRKNKEILNPITELVLEDDDLIRGSYYMIDPLGRFFDSTKGFHSYSKPILDIGLVKAINQVSFSERKFLERGGSYEF